MHSSPDLWHRTIKPVAAYYDGANSPVYAKPSQPYILGKESTKPTQPKPQSIWPLQLAILLLRFSAVLVLAIPLTPRATGYRT